MHRLIPALCLLFVAACSSETTDAPADQPADEAPEPIDSYELREEVEVIFDDVDMPHVFAQNDYDLFYAAGYQQARDRLFSLDMSRRAAMGTQSEVLGEGRLSADIQARVIGFERLANESLAQMRETAPGDHNLIIAYTAGANRYVEEVMVGERDMPDLYTSNDIAPTPFAPEEFLAHALRIQFGFSSTLEFDILNTLVGVVAAEDGPEIAVHQPVSGAYIMGAPVRTARRGLEPENASESPATERPTLDAAELALFLKSLNEFTYNLGQGEGSNAWTVTGSKTANGRPMLASDSHARYYEPNVMHVMHLNSADAGGEFDVAGLGFGGVPGIQVGMNRDIAWGATTAFADCTDLWDVAVEDGVVTYGDREIALETTEETIRVLQDDGTVVDETITVERVPGVGVLLPDALLPVPGGLLARGELLLGWPGFDRPNSDFSVFLDFARAGDVSDFRAAVNRQITGMQNWHVVSAESMGYQTGSLVPVRGSGVRASTVLDGSDPATTWNGEFVERSKLPGLRNVRDFIMSANQDPFGHTADGDPHNDDFYFGSFFAPHFRAGYLDVQLREMTDRGEITIEEMTDLQMNVHSSAADRFFVHLSAAMERLDDPVLADSQAARASAEAGWEVLDAWDRKMLRTSTEASLFRIFSARIAADILADDMGLLFDAIASEEPVFVTKFAIMALDQNSEGLLDGPPEPRLVEALAEAYDEWKVRGEPQWQETMQAEWLLPDRSVNYRAVDGGDSTVAVAQCRFHDGTDLADRCVATSGSVWRYVASFRDDGRPEMVFTVPVAETGSTDDWRDGVYRPMRFERAEVEANRTTKYVLRP